jgi:hypothetical protein
MTPSRGSPQRRRLLAGLILLLVAAGFCLVPLCSRPVLAGSGVATPTPRAGATGGGTYGFGFATLRDTPTAEALPLAEGKVVPTPTPAGLGPSEAYSVTNGMIFGAGILLLLVVVGFLIGLGQIRRER